MEPRRLRPAGTLKSDKQLGQALSAYEGRPEGSSAQRWPPTGRSGAFKARTDGKRAAAAATWERHSALSWGTTVDAVTSWR